MHAGQTATAAGPAHVGIMIARQATLVGLRVHITAAPRGVRDAWLPAPAAVHDIQVMPALFDQARVIVSISAMASFTTRPRLSCWRRATSWWMRYRGATARNVRSDPRMPGASSACCASQSSRA